MHHTDTHTQTHTHTPTLIMLLLRGNSDLPSRNTEVLLASTPAWLPGVMGDPEASAHSPFSTAASPLGMVASPTFTGARLPSSPNSAIGTWSMPVHTCTRCRARLYVRRTPVSMRRSHSEARCSARLQPGLLLPYTGETRRLLAQPGANEPEPPRLLVSPSGFERQGAVLTSNLEPEAVPLLTRHKNSHTTEASAAFVGCSLPPPTLD